MASAASEIRKIVRDMVNSMDPSDAVYATYLGDCIKVDNKPETVPLDFVDIPDHLKDVEAYLSFTVTDTDTNEDGELVLSAGNDPHVSSLTVNKLKVTIERKLEYGDRLTVVKSAGGQRYTVLEKVMKN